MKRMLFLVVVMVLSVSVGFAQDPNEIGAGTIVDALSSVLVLVVGWALRRWVFPSLNGLAFLGIIVLIITPALAWAVTAVQNLYDMPGNSYMMSVLYGLLSVLIKAIQTEWLKWRNGTPEGLLRGSK